MNIPFEFTVNYTGTPGLGFFFSSSSNLLIAGWANYLGGYTGDLADTFRGFGLSIPNGRVILTGLSVTADKPGLLEFGVNDSDLGVFTPFYSTRAGVVRNFVDGFPAVNSDDDSLFLGLRITPTTNPVTVSVCGDIQLKVLTP